MLVVLVVVILVLASSIPSAITSYSPAIMSLLHGRQGLILQSRGQTEDSPDDHFS
jgi:hypothetical protein